MNSELNIPTLPLFKLDLLATNLIEASAGTGKTWTISSLYLRLIVELGLLPEQILVVTFTKAATAELKDRIRLRMLQLRELLREHQPLDVDDNFTAELLEQGLEPELMLDRINRAIQVFDDAAILTIHGFCQRALSDYAFESGQTLTMDMLADESELFNQAVTDYWRIQVSEADSDLVSRIVSQYKTPVKLGEFLVKYIARPYVRRKLPEALDKKQCLLTLEEAYSALISHWQSGQIELHDFLSGSPLISHRSYKKNTVKRWTEEVAIWLSNDHCPTDQTCKVLERFTPQAVLKYKKDPAIEIPIMPLLEKFEAVRVALKTVTRVIDYEFAVFLNNALTHCSKNVKQLKLEARLQSYNDMLQDLSLSLKSNNADKLLKSLRKDYHVALIDEFQDTDPLQYDIFNAIFSSADLPMTMVGDPKQAIYSFRGADVFAYLQAREHATHVYTLDTNWRSVPGLIRALNCLFSGEHDIFKSNQIDYHPMQSPQTQTEQLLIDGKPASPLVFSVAESTAEDPINIGDGEAISLQDTAMRIAALLRLSSEGRACLQQQDKQLLPLNGSHMAVLVRSHHHAECMQNYLQEVGVPSVRRTQDNVFHSQEAYQLQNVLRAMAEPTQGVLLRTALCSDLIGLSGNQIEQLQNNDENWRVWVERFLHYHQLWHDYGLLRALRECQHQLEISRRLLSYSGGERKLTNLQQLVELLQTYAINESADMHTLLHWFEQQRHAKRTAADEYLIRLESDDLRVQVITIHASKGLEYPIVFCPTLWKSKKTDTKHPAVYWHDPGSDYQATLDFGSRQFQEALETADKEQFAEDMRLAYVALTRARHMCCVVVGNFKETESAPVNWWVDPENNMPGDWNMKLQSLIEKQGDVISIETMQLWEPEKAIQWSAGDQPVSLRARSFTGSIPHAMRMTSFSSLHNGHSPDAPDYDQQSTGERQPATGIHMFPRGARCGRCLHAIYENWDFTCSDEAALQQLIKDQLLIHGFDDSWQDTVYNNVHDVLSTELNSKGLQLAQIENSWRMNELEFHFPLTDINSDGLRDIIEPWFPDLPWPSFSTISGYMKGFIDLIFEANGQFYVLDYKSNWLGIDANAYDQAAIENAMNREGYILQYLIYVVAVHRLLKSRLESYDYDRDFGDVLYLFLRGMAPKNAAQNGIYTKHPDRQLIDSLDNYFQGETC